MLATKTFTTLMQEVTEPEAGLTLNRKAGVLKQLKIPTELCKTSEYLTASIFDSSTSTITICKGETIQAITNVFGVRGDCAINVMFIRPDLAVVELKEGEVYMQNAQGYIFGYDTDGRVTKHVDKIKWMSIAELYDYLNSSVMHRFNVSEREAIDYIYNAEFSVSLTYTENPPSKVAQTHSYSDFRYRMTDMSGSVACGLFDFIVFEKEEEKEEYNIYDKFNKRPRKRKSVDAEPESYVEKSDEETYDELAAKYDEDCDDAFEEVEMDPEDDEFGDWNEEYGADDTDGYYDD